MSDFAIRVENISKRYTIGALNHRHDTLRERVADSVIGLFRPNGQSHWRDSKIWALRDVSLEVRHGEVVGIIGPNGAGKSTLLKILSRITEPTEGRGKIHGRVGSLLEVGTGFHPELTGRENIYLNGAILGMKKAEIDCKFDAIVDFAEVEKFIDTPVKRYSSGMYVRLAFSVAAHLEFDILLVDEVLAVGDAAFQKKCLSRMGSAATQGRTVLFVSHNLGAVTTLCNRALLFDRGQLRKDGIVSDVIVHYQSQLLAGLNGAVDLRGANREGTGKARFSSISITARNTAGLPCPVAYAGCDLDVRLSLACTADIRESNISLIVYDSNGYRLIDASTAHAGTFVRLAAGEEVQARFLLRDVLLKPGTYFVGLWIGRGGIEKTDHVEYATSITIEPNPETIKHVEIFPGPYVCRFETAIGLPEVPNALPW